MQLIEDVANPLAQHSDIEPLNNLGECIEVEGVSGSCPSFQHIINSAI